jgi:hypothetical protein
MSYDLGFIDLEQKTLQPLDNPFGPSVTRVLGALCYLCVRVGQVSFGAVEGIKAAHLA